MKHKLLLLCMSCVLVILPLLKPSDFILRMLIVIFMFATLAESWNIIGGYTGYFSFGQTIFFGIGAYTTAILVRIFNLSPFLIAPLCGFLAMCIAICLGTITLRLSGAYFTISTLVTMLAIRVLVENATEITGGAKGIALPFPNMDVHLFLKIIYYIQFVFLLLSVLLVYRIVNSKFGLGLKSIREDEEVAEVLGVETVKYKAYAYALSAFFPAMVGAIWSYDMSYIWPFTAFDINMEVMTIVMVIFGGTGTIMGPLVGSSTLILLREMLRYTYGGSGSMYLILFGGILILIVIFMPEGIARKLIARIGGAPK